MDLSRTADQYGFLSSQPLAPEEWSSFALSLLAECPPLEFYVCDEQANYVLCANDHDVVIGWGEATAWVRSLGCG